MASKKKAPATKKKPSVVKNTPAAAKQKSGRSNPFVLPAGLAQLVDQVCASDEHPEDKTLVFDWGTISEDKQRAFLEEVFNDSRIPGDFAPLLDRDAAAGQIFWKSTICVPFALKHALGAKFTGDRYPQFGRLLLIDQKGAVFGIAVDGSAAGREAARDADRWEKLGLQKRDAAFQARQRSRKKASADVGKASAQLIAQATPLVAKGDHAAALAVLEPTLRDQEAIRYKSPGPSYALCTDLGGALDLYGVSLFGVGRKDEAIAAFRKAYDCNAKTSVRAWGHLVTALCLAGDVTGAAQAATDEEDWSDAVAGSGEAREWVKQLGAVDGSALRALAGSSAPQARGATALLKWMV